MEVVYKVQKSVDVLDGRIFEHEGSLWLLTNSGEGVFLNEGHVMKVYATVKDLLNDPEVQEVEIVKIVVRRKR